MVHSKADFPLSQGAASRVEILEIIDFLSAKASPFRLVRVGGKSDGAYLVPDCLEGVEACFSPGVANRKFFEDDLLDRFDIKSFLLDFSSSEADFFTPLAHGKQFFLKKWLGPTQSNETISLSRWVADQKLDESMDLILQMDIEGAEFENILSTSRDELSRFRVIVLEIHDIGSRILGGDYRVTLLPMVRHLSQDFIVVHSHPNNCCGSVKIAEVGFSVPQVLEVTLLRKDFLLSNRSTRNYKPQSPHFLDIARNDLLKRPLVLGKGWGNFGFSPIRQLLILRLWLSYGLFLVLNPSESMSMALNWAYRSKRSIQQRLSSSEGIE